MTHPYARLFFSLTPPTVDDDSSAGYEEGDFWIVPGSAAYQAVDVTVGAAVWTTGGGGSAPTTTAANDFQVGDGAGNWIKKTLAQTVTILQTLLDSVYAAISHSHAASAVTNTPSGNISSTDVQGAINELDTEKIATSALDTDGTLTANSDAKIASQKATKTYVDALLAANDAAVYKGAIDCSSNPNYPAASAGHTYRVSVAGKIGGASGPNVEAGDLLLCFVDGTASGNHATVGANWDVIQTNLDGAVIGPTSVTTARIATFNGTSGKLIQESTKTVSDLLIENQIQAATAEDDEFDATDQLVARRIDGAIRILWSTVVTQLQGIFDSIYLAIDGMFNDAEGNPSALGPAADGTSTYAARRDHVHEITNGSAVLGSAFSITGTAGTYQDTGLSVTLPSAGTYKISGDVRAHIRGNAGTAWWIHCELFNSTDSAAVTNSERLIVLTGTNSFLLQNTAPLSWIVTVAASKTIKLYAARNGNGSPSWTTSNIESDTNGRTAMMYEKIG